MMNRTVCLIPIVLLGLLGASTSRAEEPDWQPTLTPPPFKGATKSSNRAVEAGAVSVDFVPPGSGQYHIKVMGRSPGECEAPCTLHLLPGSMMVSVTGDTNVSSAVNIPAGGGRVAVKTRPGWLLTTSIVLMAVGGGLMIGEATVLNDQDWKAMSGEADADLQHPRAAMFFWGGAGLFLAGTAVLVGYATWTPSIEVDKRGSGASPFRFAGFRAAPLPGPTAGAFTSASWVF